MKKLKIITVEDIKYQFKFVDLSPLSERITSKNISKLEQCLTEVLDELFTESQIHDDVMNDILFEAIGAGDRRAFMDAYIRFTKERGEVMQMNSIGSKRNDFFYQLHGKLADLEDKQNLEGKVVTVANARLLASIVNRQIQNLYMKGAADQAKFIKFDQSFNYWMQTQRNELEAATKGLTTTARAS